VKNNSLWTRETASKTVFWTAVFALFLPVIILPPYFQPSDWTRSILLKIILTAVISFLLFSFFYKKNFPITLPKWNASLYLAPLILAGYFATLLLATIFSQDVAFSIFGSPNRAGGMLNLLFFFIFSILLTLFISKAQWEKLFYALFVAGFLASLMAVVQYFNILKNVLISYEGGSTPSFLGNSTALAAYMLFLAFLSFVFFIQKQNKKEKLLHGGLFLLFIFTIFITGSRAAYLALLAGFLYFFLFYPYPQKYKRLKIAAATLLAAAILVIALFNVFPGLGKTNTILGTIASRVSVTRIAQDIFGTRLSAWKMTWRAIQEKPLLGWGPENFYIGFEKYYDPKPFATPKLLWDRPHNIILDVMADSGIVSVLAYLGFWIALFWQLQHIKNVQEKNVWHGGHALKIHGVQAMFIAYLIVLFFNFNNFSTHLISFFFIGYSFYLIFLQGEPLTLSPPQNIFFPKKTLAAAWLAGLIIFIWFWNIKPLYLNEKIVHAKNLASDNHCKKAFDIAHNENWEKSGILKPYAILLYADIIKNCAFIEPEKEVEYSEKMVSLLKIAVDAQPMSSVIWHFMGTFTNVLAAREKNAEYKIGLAREAMEYLKRGRELSPKRQGILAEMEKNYLIAEDYKSMEALGMECIAIDPRFGECYWHLGIAQIFLGNQEDGKKNIEAALKNGYTTPHYKQLAIAYMSQENWREAVAAYEKVPIYYENKYAAASIHTALALLYDRAGEYAKAGESALQVFKLQPENPETLKFIKLLLGKKPNDPILNSSLAFIYQQPGPQQELSKARAIYQQLVGDYPKNPSYRWRLIEIYYAQGEDYRAYAEVISVLKLFPEQKSQVENFIKKLPPAHWENYTRGVGL